MSAVVGAVTKQENGTTQGIVSLKSQLVKKGLSISRLELVAGHMASNLVTNIERAIGSEKITSVHCCALYWINGQGEYRQFVSNRVRKIREHERIEWHLVGTTENPADLGRRVRQRGSQWLNDQGR